MRKENTSEKENKPIARDGNNNDGDKKRRKRGKEDKDLLFKISIILFI